MEHVMPKMKQNKKRNHRIELFLFVNIALRMHSTPYMVVSVHTQKHIHVNTQLQHFTDE